MEGRRSVGGLLVLVGLVGVEAAVARRVHAFWPERYVAVIAMAVVAQAAGLWGWRATRGRAFWLGFAACGLLAAGSLAWASVHPSVAVLGSLTPGRPAMLTTSHRVGPVVSRAWDAVGDAMSGVLDAPLRAVGMTGGPRGRADTLVLGLCWLLPQVAMAGVGGAGAWLVAWAWRGVFGGREAADTPSANH